MSSGRMPLTRREAQEPHAGDRIAEERERDQHFQEHHREGYAASERLQRSIEVYNDEPWSLPKSYMETSQRRSDANRETIGLALASCQDFGVFMGRSSGLGEFLDVVIGTAQQSRESKVSQQKLGRVSNAPSSHKSPLPNSFHSDSGQDPQSMSEKGPKLDSHLEGVHQQIQKMTVPIRGQLTNALCEAKALRLKPVLSLTLEDINASMTTPKATRQGVLQHLEVGLDGVEAIVYGEAYFSEEWEPSINHRTHQYLPSASRSYGNSTYSGERTGWWSFFGIIASRKDLRPEGLHSSWLCFGVPSAALDAVEPTADLKHAQIEIGGGQDEAGHVFEKVKVSMGRTILKLSRGGIAPIDFDEDDEVWGIALVKRMQHAMATFSLRISLLSDNENYQLPNHEVRSSQLPVDPTRSSMNTKRRKLRHEENSSVTRVLTSNEAKG